MKQQKKYRQKKIGRFLSNWLVLLIILGIEMLPILWVIVTSFQLTRDIIAFPPKFFFTPTLNNYKELLRLGLLSGLKNSLIIGVFTGFFTFILGVPFAYLISNYQFKRNDSVRFWILTLRILPPIAVIIPLIFLWFRLNLLDTYFALIVSYLTFSLPLFIWLSIESFKVIPPEVEEAALLEGCSRFAMFFKIALPLAFPGLTAVLIFTFIFIWNEFFFAFALTSRLQTLPLLVASHAQAVYTAPWGTLSALTAVLSIPPIVLVFFLSKFMTRHFIVVS